MCVTNPLKVGKIIIQGGEPKYWVNVLEQMGIDK